MKKTESIKIHLTQHDKKMLSQMQKEYNFSGLSPLCYFLLFRQLKNLKHIPKNVDELIFQLKKIGVNINQITQKINRLHLLKSTVSEKEILNFIDNLNNEFENLNHIVNLIENHFSNDK